MDISVNETTSQSGFAGPFLSEADRINALELVLPEFGAWIQRGWDQATQPTPAAHEGVAPLADRPDLSESHWAALVYVTGIVHDFDDIYRLISFRRAWLARARAAGWTAFETALDLHQHGWEAEPHASPHL
jgi:hypothetical protein